MNTNREYLKTLAQQEDLNWDGDSDLDAEYECVEEEDLAASLRANKVSLDEYIVKYFTINQVRKP